MADTNTKESRVIRTRDVTHGTISFEDVKTKKTVLCDARNLWDAGTWADDGAWLTWWQGLPIIVRHLILHGINGKVGDTVASKDKDGPKTMRASWAALVAQTWSQGGGGSPLDTYTVVLREMVRDALVSIGWKKTDAEKKTREAPAAAYRLFVESLTPKGGNVDEGFANVWPTLEKTARTEAGRRDNAAPVVDVAALLAAATLPKKDAA